MLGLHVPLIVTTSEGLDRPLGRGLRHVRPEVVVVVLGLLLWILGLVFGIGILQTIGIVLLVVGLILLVLGAAGRPVGGRRHWY